MTGHLCECQTTPSKDKWLLVDGIISWVIGITLIISAVPHLGNPYFFLGSIYAYQMVTPGLGQMITMILPVTQLIVAVCLIGRFFVNASNIVALLMIGVFALVQTMAYLRDLNIACGCFGPEHDITIGWFTLSIVYGLLMLSIARNVVACSYLLSNKRSER